MWSAAGTAPVVVDVAGAVAGTVVVDAANVLLTEKESSLIFCPTAREQRPLTHKLNLSLSCFMLVFICRVKPRFD